MVVTLAVSLLLLGADAGPGVVTYEGDVFPEQAGWERDVADTPGAMRSIDDGWFVQAVTLPEGWPEPYGERDLYRMGLGSFSQAPSFFVEWRVITDNPSWLIDKWQIPVGLSAYGTSSALYHTVITGELVRLLRDLSLPLVFTSIAESTPHTYRLEVTGSYRYVWYVDGIVRDAGTSDAPFPTGDSGLIWGASRDYVDAVTRWDYIRFGVIPKDGSGDYDSDGAVSAFDYYFAAECMDAGGPGHDAGPGCRFADFDGDSDIDLADFAEFQLLFSE